MYSRSLQARRVVESEGLFTQGSVGQLRPHPALQIEREATTAFWKFAGEFGLTPVARTRLAVGELHRQSLAVEFQHTLGEPILTPAD